jgi:hypothetical protein
VKAGIGGCALLVSLPATAAAHSSGSGITEVRVSHSPSSSVTPEGATTAIAVDPSSDTIAVTGYANRESAQPDASGRVWLVDGRTHKLKATVTLSGAERSGIAFDAANGMFVLADSVLVTPEAPALESGAVVEISPSGKVADEISVPRVSNAIAVNSNTNTIYAASSAGDGALAVIDGHTGTVTTTVDGVDYPAAVSVAPGGTVFAGGGAGGGTTGIWEVDGSNNAPIGFNGSTEAVTIGTPNPPAALASAGATTYAAWVYNETVVATVRGTRITHELKIKTGNPTSYGMALDGSALYVANQSDIDGCPNFIARISTRTGKVSGGIFGIDDAWALAVDPKSDTVWSTNGDDVAAFRGGFSNKEKKCGSGGIVLGT